MIYRHVLYALLHYMQTALLSPRNFLAGNAMDRGQVRLCALARCVPAHTPASRASVKLQSASVRAGLKPMRTPLSKVKLSHICKRQGSFAMTLRFQNNTSSFIILFYYYYYYYCYFVLNIIK